MKSQTNIEIKNAYENNLKHIDVKIPLNKWTCVTGVSGCGKSSLIFDTLYAESQRSFFESMASSTYGQKIMDKPKVDYIKNLHPALSVAQNYYNRNPRSTVGTITDIAYYLHTLFAFIINEEKKLNLTDSYFSGNNITSCCSRCHGLGEEFVVSFDQLVPNPNKTLRQGAIIYFKGSEKSLEMRLLSAICERHGIDIDSKYCDLSEKEKDFLLNGSKAEERYDVRFKTTKGRYKQWNIPFNGALTDLQEKLKDVETPSTYQNIQKYLTKQKCSVCHGSRLSEKILQHYICDKNIAELEEMPLLDIEKWTEQVLKKYSKKNFFEQIKQLLTQITTRCNSLIGLKVGYLSLNRSIPTLSGGEVQRIRLSNQLNCNLTGLVYILDEPCKGLHFRNTESIIEASKKLAEKGNTVISIEHNSRYINSSDLIIELGPKGGSDGGYLMSEKVPTRQQKYNLDFKKDFELKDNIIELDDICFRTIQHQNIKIPFGKITCVTGVSGSGKSTLLSVINSCYEYKKAINCRNFAPSKIRKCIAVNQLPLGKTPRSTVISYLEISERIRELFASTTKAKTKGLGASSFSMNVAAGRCECCQGTGLKKIEMNYLPESYIKCPECEGKRFEERILEVTYNGKNINDVLNEPVSKIIDTFKNEEPIKTKLQCLIDLGLGYVSLGQMSMTLSGGEAQRIKLAKALGDSKNESNMYLLDEPTSGLNEKDIEKFAVLIQQLSEKGQTIVIIEHNIEFIAANADWIIDFGLNAGISGGTVVAIGTAKEVFENKISSLFLKDSPIL